MRYESLNNPESKKQLKVFTQVFMSWIRWSRDHESDIAVEKYIALMREADTLLSMNHSREEALWYMNLMSYVLLGKEMFQ